jgi:hypothetical protein
LRDKELRPIRRETDDKGPHAEGGGYRRLRKQHRAKQATNWVEVGSGRSAQAGRPSPFRGLVGTPFDLDASRGESHASINLSSALEEQRRLRDTILEMRVMLVVQGLPSRRGNLAWKTTSELRIKDQDRGRIPVVILFM